MQYFIFVKQALAGDLGRSFAFNTPAIELILQRVPATMELAVTAMLMAILLGIPLGLYAGLKPDSASSPRRSWPGPSSGSSPRPSGSG